MDALRGIGLILRTPRLWGLCVGPLLGAILAYVLLGVVGGFLLLPRLGQWLGGLPGGDWWAGLAGVGAFVVWLLLFPFLFILFGGIFFGLIFEPLSLEVERVTRPGTDPVVVKLTFLQAIGDTLSRLVLNVSLGLVALLLGFWLGPVPGVIAAGLIGLLDYTSPAFLRRGLRLGAQSSRLLRRPDWQTLTFALAAGLLSLVPLVGVLCLPGLVAGGTLLTLRTEEK